MWIQDRDIPAEDSYGNTCYRCFAPPPRALEALGRDSPDEITSDQTRPQTIGTHGAIDYLSSGQALILATSAGRGVQRVGRGNIVIPGASHKALESTRRALLQPLCDGNVFPEINPFASFVIAAEDDPTRGVVMRALLATQIQQIDHASPKYLATEEETLQRKGLLTLASSVPQIRRPFKKIPTPSTHLATEDPSRLRISLSPRAFTFVLDRTRRWTSTVARYPSPPPSPLGRTKGKSGTRTSELGDRISLAPNHFPFILSPSTRRFLFSTGISRRNVLTLLASADAVRDSGMTSLSQHHSSATTYKTGFLPYDLHNASAVYMPHLSHTSLINPLNTLSPFVTPGFLPLLKDEQKCDAADSNFKYDSVIAEPQQSTVESSEQGSGTHVVTSSTSDSEGGSVTGHRRVIVRNEQAVKRKKEMVKDDAYWERRRKNNDAAKRSRDSRRQKEDEIAVKAAILEQENMRLKVEVHKLREETTRLRVLILSPPTAHLAPLPSSTT
uniref:BZIP domain-containing protein n=1 Tax=Steinernema glaseri TaxID=37863 RepID=A0A1I7ZH14_9BILA